MVDFTEKDYYRLYDLENIIKLLRSEGGCPWDREQTHESIRRNLLEEAYEVCEAIDDKDPEHMKEELGDVLMQVVFHSDIERENGNFCLDDVADGVCKKLITRHPHVFGDVVAETSEKVLDNWDAIKMRERSQSKTSDTMKTVARSLPALWRADKVISKAEKGGVKLDSKAAAAILEKAAAVSGDVSGDTIGDILFAAVLLARSCGIDPEYALTDRIDKFIGDFEKAEASGNAAAVYDAL